MSPTGAPRNVILIGYRGSGKSRVSELLADRLGWEQVDTDTLIEGRCGKTIRAIFAEDGEAHFRALEQDAIHAATAHDRRVISVGGGAVINADNRMRLQQAGLCIWLTAPAEELYRRMTADPRQVDLRPALTEREPLDEIRALLREREPLYAATADEVVDTAGKPLATVVERVLTLVAQRA